MNVVHKVKFCLFLTLFERKEIFSFFSSLHNPRIDASVRIHTLRTLHAAIDYTESSAEREILLHNNNKNYFSM